jgi:hypothetical protein
MRTITCVAVLMALALPVTASAVTVDSFWWVGLEDLEWNAVPWLYIEADGDIPSSGPTTPDQYHDVYISDTGFGGGWYSHVGTPEVATGMDAHTRQLYIGGWPGPFDDYDGAGPGEVGHGSAIGREGRLLISGGTLTVHELVAPTSDPPCAYTRVGYRGAVGEVEQTGGMFKDCTTITMGWSSDSLGIWKLRAGTVETFGFDVGIQGTGFLDIRGGEVEPLQGVEDPDEDPWSQVGVTSIGGSYHSGPNARIVDDPLAGDTYSPGVGLVNVGGGKLHVPDMYVGHHLGGVGVLAVRPHSDMWLPAPSMPLSVVQVAAPAPPSGQTNPGWSYYNHGALRIGAFGGTGVVSQSGGLVEANWIALGREEGSYGQLVIEGGKLHQAGSPNSFTSAFYNGPDIDRTVTTPGENHPQDPDDADDPHTSIGGRGNLTVIGNGTFENPLEVDIDGDYFQGPGSRLTVVLDSGAVTEPLPWVGILGAPIATIDVGGTATFRPGSVLDVRIARAANIGAWGRSPTPKRDEEDEPIPGTEQPYYAEPGESWTILVADDIDIEANAQFSPGLRCANESAEAGWKYGVVGSALRIAYCPAGASHPICSNANYSCPCERAAGSGVCAPEE